MDTASTVGQVISFVLWVCVMLLLARLVLEWVQQLARSWRPTGAVAVVAEGIYTVTDPPLRAVRRVVPPVRMGGIMLDLSLLIVLVVLYVLQIIVARTLL